jgi:hypothetical protein
MAQLIAGVPDPVPEIQWALEGSRQTHAKINRTFYFSADDSWMVKVLMQEKGTKACVQIVMGVPQGPGDILNGFGIWRI